MSVTQRPPIPSFIPESAPFTPNNVRGSTDCSPAFLAWKRA